MIHVLLRKAHKDFKEVENLMRSETKNQTAKLNAWDTAYYCDLLEEKKFGKSEEGLWNYFEVNHVVGETLKIY